MMVLMLFALVLGTEGSATETRLRGGETFNSVSNWLFLHKSTLQVWPEGVTRIRWCSQHAQAANIVATGAPPMIGRRFARFAVSTWNRGIMKHEGPKNVIDREMSKQIAEAVEAQAGMCYRNARRALMGVPGLGKAKYVEGWVIDLCQRGIQPPKEHGWLEMNGHVIEPTEPDAAYIYFGVMRYDRAEVRRWGADAPEDVPYIRQHYERESPEFKRYGHVLGEAMKLCNEFFGVTRPLGSVDFA